MPLMKGTWEVLDQTLSESLSNVSVVSCGGYVYVIGGRDAATFEPTQSPTEAPTILLLQQLEPFTPSRGENIGNIDVVDEMHLDLYLMIHSLPSSWHNVLHCGNGNAHRFPSIFISQNEGLKVMVADGDIWNALADAVVLDDISTDTVYHIEIVFNQSWFTLDINGDNAFEQNKSHHSLYSSVPCYASFPSQPAANVTIFNLTIWTMSSTKPSTTSTTTTLGGERSWNGTVHRIDYLGRVIEMESMQLPYGLYDTAAIVVDNVLYCFGGKVYNGTGGYMESNSWLKWTFPSEAPTEAVTSTSHVAPTNESSTSTITPSASTEDMEIATSPQSETSNEMVFGVAIMLGLWICGVLSCLLLRCHGTGQDLRKRMADTKDVRYLAEDIMKPPGVLQTASESVQNRSNLDHLNGQVIASIPPAPAPILNMEGMGNDGQISRS